MINTEMRGVRAIQSKFDIVAIAASAGAHEPLKQLLSNLPENFGCAIVLVHHLRALSPELLSNILRRQVKMAVKCGENGERLVRGSIYTAQPGYFPMVNADLTLSLRPLTNSIRNPTDLLFESVALSCKERGIGVVLSGLGSDGARGVRSIKGAQGRVFAQDEKTSAYFDMPAAAISTGCVDFVLPPKKIASALAAFVMVSGAAELFAVPLPSWAQLAS